MFLFWRAWRRLHRCDGLGAALFLLHKAVAFEQELTSAQRVGMRHLELQGFVEYDPGGHDPHWHFYSSPESLYKWAEREADRLRLDLETYSIDEIDEFRHHKTRPKWLQAA